MVITILSNVLINMRHQGGRLPYTRGGRGGSWSSSLVEGLHLDLI